MIDFSSCRNCDDTNAVAHQCILDKAGAVQKNLELISNPNFLRQILRFFRGNSSQMQLSRELGFQFNQVHRWEAGITYISWKDFVRLVNHCKPNLLESMKSILNYRGDLGDTSELVTFLIGDRTLTEAASSSGFSRFVIGRWVKEKGEPKFTDIMRLLGYLSGSLQPFMEFLGQIMTSPTSDVREEDKDEGFEEVFNSSLVLVCSHTSLLKIRETIMAMVHEINDIAERESMNGKGFLVLKLDAKHFLMS